jgi:hypothetical protein
MTDPASACWLLVPMRKCGGDLGPTAAVKRFFLRDRICRLPRQCAHECWSSIQLKPGKLILLDPKPAAAHGCETRSDAFESESYRPPSSGLRHDDFSAKELRKRWRTYWAETALGALQRQWTAGAADSPAASDDLAHSAPLAGWPIPNGEQPLDRDLTAT